jgi:hypothetical protein
LRTLGSRTGFQAGSVLLGNASILVIYLSELKRHVNLMTIKRHEDISGQASIYVHETLLLVLHLVKGDLIALAIPRSVFHLPPPLCPGNHLAKYSSPISTFCKLPGTFVDASSVGTRAFSELLPAGRMVFVKFPSADRVSFLVAPRKSRTIFVLCTPSTGRVASLVSPRSGNSW